MSIAGKAENRRGMMVGEAGLVLDVACRRYSCWCLFRWDGGDSWRVGGMSPAAVGELSRVEPLGLARGGWIVLGMPIVLSRGLKRASCFSEALWSVGFPGVYFAILMGIEVLRRSFQRRARGSRVFVGGGFLEWSRRRCRRSTGSAGTDFATPILTHDFQKMVLRACRISQRWCYVKYDRGSG